MIRSNLKRGLRRAIFVCAVGWFVAVLFLSYEDILRPKPSKEAANIFEATRQFLWDLELEGLKEDQRALLEQFVENGYCDLTDTDENWVILGGWLETYKDYGITELKFEEQEIQVYRDLLKEGLSEELKVRIGNARDIINLLSNGIGFDGYSADTYISNYKSFRTWYPWAEIPARELEVYSARLEQLKINAHIRAIFYSVGLFLFPLVILYMSGLILLWVIKGFVTEAKGRSF